MPLALALLATLFVLPIGAQESAVDEPTLPEAYGEMLSNLPDAIKEGLPKGVFSTDAEEVARAWEALSSPRELIFLLLSPWLADWKQYLGLFFCLVGVLLLRGVSNVLIENIRTPVLAGGVKLLCRVSLFGVIFGQAIAGMARVTAFYQDLNTLSSAFLPLMGTMYALGGQVAAAAVNHTTLVLSMSLVQWVGSQSVVPLFSLCLAFGLLGAISGEVAGRMQLLTGKLKKWYTTGLSLVMLVLSASLGAQTTLAARADSLSFRTLRFAVSSTIPMVGGGVAEMLRTASTGVDWLRGIVGIGGILLLIRLLCPALCSLLLYRAVFSLAGDVAAILGCPEEGRLMGEVSSLYGYLLAVLSLCMMTFLFSLLFLLKCTALG